VDAQFTGSTSVRGCLLELRVSAVEAEWESTVNGELRLTGGQQEQIINRLDVVLTNPTEGEVVGRDSPFEMDAVRFGRVIVSPLEERVLPFSLKMGWGVGFSTPVYVRATAQVNRISFSQVAASIHALPPAAFALVAEVAAAEAQAQVGAWSSIDAGDGAFATLTVGEAMRSVFDRLSLRLYRGSGMVYGSLKVDPHERSLRDQLRAAAGLGVVTVDFRFPIGDREAAQKFFCDILRPYVNAVRELPIPANAVHGSADQLPRPSYTPNVEP
jgi:hypothetical protein